MSFSIPCEKLIKTQKTEKRSPVFEYGKESPSNLPSLEKPFNFQQCGFKNRRDCKLLCKQTKRLIKKYPKKQKGAKKKKTKQLSEKNNYNNDDLEGKVKDTGHK